MTSLGSVNLIVFDKTGTLTEEQVEIKGYLPVKYNNSKNKFEFGNYMSEIANCSKITVSHFKKKSVSDARGKLDIDGLTFFQ